MKYFILAGGYGKRVQPLSSVKPKPVFPLDGTPLIHILLNRLKAAGLVRGFINTHHLPGAVESCVRNWQGEGDGCGIRFLHEQELSGSKILKEAVPELDRGEPLLSLNGDTFMEIPVEAMTRLVNRTDVDGVLVARKNRNPRYNGLLIDGDGFFTGRDFFFCRGITETLTEDTLMFTGTAMFKPHVLQHFDRISFFDSLENREFPFHIKILEYDGIWLDIGSPAGYLEANFAYKQYIWPGDANPTGRGNAFSPGVTVSVDSIVEGSVVWENTEITGGSVIRNCIVTGNMSLNGVHHENDVIIQNTRALIPSIK